MASVDVSQISQVSQVNPGQRERVERALSTRFGPSDGHSGSATLADKVASGRFLSKGARVTNGRKSYGLHMIWPGMEHPQFLPIARVVWECIDLPIDVESVSN